MPEAPKYTFKLWNTAATFLRQPLSEFYLILNNSVISYIGEYFHY